MRNYLYSFIYIVVAIIFVWGSIYVFKGSKRKSGRWGLNINLSKGGQVKSRNILTEVKCPICGQELPKVRVPRSFKQILWGGWTCGKCGQRVDKWGNPEND